MATASIAVASASEVSGLQFGFSDIAQGLGSIRKQVVVPPDQIVRSAIIRLPRLLPRQPGRLPLVARVLFRHEADEARTRTLFPAGSIGHYPSDELLHCLATFGRRRG